MRNFILLLCSGFAGVLVLVGCRHEGPPSQLYVSRSCDAVAVDGNGRVLAAINTEGNTGHIDPYGPLDDSPTPPYYSADVCRYDPTGHRQLARDFWYPEPDGMHQVGGLWSLPGNRTLIAGAGSNFVSMVVDSSFGFESAQFWGSGLDAYVMTGVPAGGGLACLYEAVSMLVPFRLAFLDADGGAIFDIGEVNAGRLVGLSNGHAVTLNGAVVREYAPSSNAPVWTLNSLPRRFGSAGENIVGNLMLFGTYEADSLSNRLAVVTRVADTLQYRSCAIRGGTVAEVSVAARSADSTWLIACVTSSDNDFCVVRYDGTDTAQVVSTWSPDGDPVTTCAATGNNGWVVFGGHIKHSGARRQDSFVRTYTRDGLPDWADVINGE